MTGVRCELPGGCWLQELCSSMISDKYDTKPGRVKTSQPTNIIPRFRRPFKVATFQGYDLHGYDRSTARKTFVFSFHAPHISFYLLKLKGRHF